MAKAVRMVAERIASPVTSGSKYTVGQIDAVGTVNLVAAPLFPEYREASFRPATTDARLRFTQTVSTGSAHYARVFARLSAGPASGTQITVFRLTTADEATTFCRWVADGTTGHWLWVGPTSTVDTGVAITANEVVSLGLAHLGGGQVAAKLGRGEQWVWTGSAQNVSGTFSPYTTLTTWSIGHMGANPSGGPTLDLDDYAINGAYGESSGAASSTYEWPGPDRHTVMLNPCADYEWTGDWKVEIPNAIFMANRLLANSADPTNNPKGASGWTPKISYLNGPTHPYVALGLQSGYANADATVVNPRIGAYFERPVDAGVTTDYKVLSITSITQASFARHYPTGGDIGVSDTQGIWLGTDFWLVDAEQDTLAQQGSTSTLVYRGAEPDLQWHVIQDDGYSPPTDGVHVRPRLSLYRFSNPVRSPGTEFAPFYDAINVVGAAMLADVQRAFPPGTLAGGTGWKATTSYQRLLMAEPTLTDLWRLNEEPMPNPIHPDSQGGASPIYDERGQHAAVNLKGVYTPIIGAPGRADRLPVTGLQTFYGNGMLCADGGAFSNDLPRSFLPYGPNVGMSIRWRDLRYIGQGQGWYSGQVTEDWSTTFMFKTTHPNHGFRWSHSTDQWHLFLHPDGTPNDGTLFGDGFTPINTRQKGRGGVLYIDYRDFETNAVRRKLLPVFVRPDHWHHVTFGFSGGQPHLYLDGVSYLLEGEEPSTMTWNGFGYDLLTTYAFSNEIGASYIGVGMRFSEIAHFSTPLSQAKIEQHAMAALYGQESLEYALATQSGLRSYWRFGDVQSSARTAPHGSWFAGTKGLYWGWDTEFSPTQTPGVPTRHYVGAIGPSKVNMLAQSALTTGDEGSSQPVDYPYDGGIARHWEAPRATHPNKQHAYGAYSDFGGSRDLTPAEGSSLQWVADLLSASSPQPFTFLLGLKPTNQGLDYGYSWPLRLAHRTYEIRFQPGRGDHWLVRLQTAWGHHLCGIDTGTYPLNPLGGTNTEQPSFGDDNWHHLAIVYDGTSAVKIYVDGVSMTTTSDTQTLGAFGPTAYAPNNDEPSPLVDRNGSGYHNTWQTDMAFLTTALSEAEVAALAKKALLNANVSASEAKGGGLMSLAIETGPTLLDGGAAVGNIEGVPAPPGWIASDGVAFNPDKSVTLGPGSAWVDMPYTYQAAPPPRTLEAKVEWVDFGADQMPEMYVYEWTGNNLAGMWLDRDNGQIVCYVDRFNVSFNVAFDPVSTKWWRFVIDNTPDPVVPPPPGPLQSAVTYSGTTYTVEGTVDLDGSTDGDTTAGPTTPRNTGGYMLAFQAPEDGTYHFEVSGGTLDDSYLYVLNENGTGLAEDDDSGVGLLSALDVSLTAGMWAYALVTGYGSGDEGTFTLAVTASTATPTPTSTFPRLTFYTSPDGTTWTDRGSLDCTHFEGGWVCELDVGNRSTAATAAHWSFGTDTLDSITVPGKTGAVGGGGLTVHDGQPDPVIDDRDAYCADPNYCARLPWEWAQRRLLAERGPTTLARGTAGWHGASYDPEQRVAFAVVNENGPFADFAGEVVRFSYVSDPRLPRSVVVYCHATGEPFEDVSLSRRAFLQLAGLGTDEIHVTGEVLERVPAEAASSDVVVGPPLPPPPPPPPDLTPHKLGGARSTARSGGARSGTAPSGGGGGGGSTIVPIFDGSTRAAWSAIQSSDATHTAQNNVPTPNGTNVIELANDPLGILPAGTKVLKMHLNEADHWTDLVRVQALSPNFIAIDGSKTYTIRRCVAFPLDYPQTDNGTFLTLGSYFGPPFAGSSAMPLGIVTRNGTERLGFTPNAYDLIWGIPLVRGVWNKIVMRVRTINYTVAPNRGVGWVEVYHAPWGQPLALQTLTGTGGSGTTGSPTLVNGNTRLNFQTVKDGHNDGPNNVRIGQYRTWPQSNFSGFNDIYNAHLAVYDDADVPNIAAIDPES